jgi:hypothetical protein
MDTPRQQLAAQIQTDNPTWIVKDYPDEPSQVRKGKPVVSIWRASIVPAARQHLDHELTLHVYGSKVQDAAAENELDNILDGILLSIERYEGARFIRAERRNLVDGAFAGFVITVNTYSPNVYRAAVLNERSADNGTTAA